MQYRVPSFGYTLLASGVAASGPAIVRTVLAYLVLRRATPEEVIALRKPATPSLARE
jgi:hypothetical protein